MKTWFEQDWSKKSDDYFIELVGEDSVSESEISDVKSTISSLPETKEEYYQMIIDECNKIFPVDFVGFEEDNRGEHVIFLEDEDGQFWNVNFHPVAYALVENIDDDYGSFAELLREKWEEGNVRIDRNS